MDRPVLHRAGNHRTFFVDAGDTSGVPCQPNGIDHEPPVPLPLAVRPGPPARDTALRRMTTPGVRGPDRLPTGRGRLIRRPAPCDLSAGRMCRPGRRMSARTAPTTSGFRRERGRSERGDSAAPVGNALYAGRAPVVASLRRWPCSCTRAVAARSRHRPPRLRSERFFGRGRWLRVDWKRATPPGHRIRTRSRSSHGERRPGAAAIIPSRS